MLYVGDGKTKGSTHGSSLLDGVDVWVGQAMAVPRREMAMAVREKRILAEVFVGCYGNG